MALINGYDKCLLMICEKYPYEFDFQDAIDLLTEAGEEDNDIRFLLASFIRQGYANYVGRNCYRWWIEIEDIEEFRSEIEYEKKQSS